MTIRKGNNDDGEPEITVETDLPQPVEPPFLSVPIETDSVAIPVDVPMDVPLALATSEPQPPVVVTPIATPKMCAVIAPATLPAGYTFAAQIDGMDFLVTVPEGGVNEGQPFSVPYPSRAPDMAATHSNPESSDAPPTHSLTSRSAITGRWRNHMCDCCEVLCNGLFWMSWCCLPILFGQLMRRKKLTACGIPARENGYTYTFWILFFSWLIVWILCATKVFQYVFYLWLIYMWVVFTNTRYHYRKQYKIPPSSCDGCDGRMDDFCCGFWCTCCVGIQMARHTHNMHDYPYVCCSQTGLWADAPDV